MSKDYFKRVVDFAQENQIIVCHDAAYSEIFYDGKPPASFMEVDGAKDVGIEFHSLSKTYNMTGWRIGFAVGQQAGFGWTRQGEEQPRLRLFPGHSGSRHYRAQPG